MNIPGRNNHRAKVIAWLIPIALLMLGASPARDASSDAPALNFNLGTGESVSSTFFKLDPPTPASEKEARPQGTVAPTESGGSPFFSLESKDTMRSIQTVALFGLVSLAPVGVLMVTAFLRINIVLVLLRQALGSPQVPGNQVLGALALMLTALIMRPVGEEVYSTAIVPYSQGGASAIEAWEKGSKPIKMFMVDQIVRTNHQEYLWSLYRYAVPPSVQRAEPVYGNDFPMRVVAPAFLLSEMTTALMMGFYLYLPFVVI